jgi:hypothetical protein
VLPASCFLLPASCFLPPASRPLPPAPASCSCLLLLPPAAADFCRSVLVFALRFRCGAGWRILLR